MRKSAAPARDGKGVIVAPIAFVSEHSETLVELDIEYRQLAARSRRAGLSPRRHGGRRMPASSPAWRALCAARWTGEDCHLRRRAHLSGRASHAAAIGDALMDALRNELANYIPWIMAFHIIAVIAWMAGMLYLPRLFVYHTETAPGSEVQRTLQGDGATAAARHHRIPP